MAVSAVVTEEVVEADSEEAAVDFVGVTEVVADLEEEEEVIVEEEVSDVLNFLFC